jgi:two-component system response regulator FixJ
VEGFGGRSIRVESAAAARYVYVVDDDTDVRASLQFLLRTREMLVVSFSDPLAFLKKLSALAPGPILLDLRMPQMDGVQLLAELVHRDVNWPVIFLTGHGELSIAVSAFKLGAVDFLEKPVSAVELEECLERAFETLGRSLATTAEKGKANLLWSLLSRRESEVISGLCAGLSNKQVAFNLSISPRTVEMHRANALRTLGVRSLAEVVNLRVKGERQI